MEYVEPPTEQITNEEKVLKFLYDCQTNAPSTLKAAHRPGPRFVHIWLQKTKQSIDRFYFRSYPDVYAQYLFYAFFRVVVQIH